MRWAARSSRLLVRYEALSTAAPRILEAQPMYIRVTPASDSEKAKALTSLKICPVLTNWMMAATWQFAHPFKGGGWHPGGDVEFDDCNSVDTTVTANPSLGTAASAPLTIGDDCKDSAVVCFNIQPWFKNYLIQRGINYGLVLVTLDNSSISIYGNGSGSRGPRIHWADGP